jgi:tRNA-2-methylthio-N6-dimethylallyladenosine synthase
MLREYTREQYLERIGWLKAARRPLSLTTDVIVGFPGETEADFAETLSLLRQVGYDAVFTFKYSPRPNTPSLGLPDVIPDEEKARRLAVLMEHQRGIQVQNYRRHVGQTLQVMVEGRRETRQQWIGRSSQNMTVNFTSGEATGLQPGEYRNVYVTQSFPNSLAGEMVV